MNQPDATTRSTTRRVALLGAVAVIGAMIDTYVNYPSRHHYSNVTFTTYYGHGVYRYRVLGRELTVGLGRVLHAVVPMVAPVEAHGYSLFWALAIVNGLAFVGVATLVGVTARTPRWFDAGVVLILAMIFSGLSLTPYDFLSYLFMAAAMEIGRAHV